VIDNLCLMECGMVCGVAYIGALGVSRAKVRWTTYSGLGSFALRESITETDKPTTVQVDTDLKGLKYNIVLIFKNNFMLKPLH